MMLNSRKNRRPDSTMSLNSFERHKVRKILVVIEPLCLTDWLMDDLYLCLVVNQAHFLVYPLKLSY